MNSIDTTISVSAINVDGVSVPLVGGSGENKFAQVIDRTVTEITTEDFEGATKVGTYAFYFCRNLKSVTIPNGVTSIEDHAFSICSSLTEVAIPDSVKSIGGQAFYNCTSLTSITIPDSVETTGNLAFGGCIALTEITIKATTPPTLSGTNAIPNNVTTIYIPTGTLSVYSTATNWSSFADKFVEKDM